MRIDYITNGEYFKTLEKDVPPYFRKEAMLTPGQYDKFRDDQFALIIMNGDGDKERYFPINNFSNTYVSSKYLEKFGSALPLKAKIVAAHYIEKAAATFGLKTSGVIKKLASLGISGRIVSDTDITESTVSPENFLIPDGYMFKVAGKEDVENYIKSHDEVTTLLSADEKREFDTNLKKFATKYNLEFREPKVEPLLPNMQELNAKLDVLPVQQKLAFLENQNIVCGRDSFVKEGMSLRLIALNELDNQDEKGRTKAHIGRELLNKISSLYYNKEITAHKFAKALAKIDNMYGWDNEYQTSIPDPVKMVVKDAMDVDILSTMDSKLAPAFAMFKSGSIDSQGLQSMVSDIMTDVFSSYSGNLLRDYMISHKDFTKLSSFAPIENILSEPTSTFKALELNKKIAFIKELVSNDNK